MNRGWSQRDDRLLYTSHGVFVGERGSCSTKGVQRAPKCGFRFCLLVFPQRARMPYQGGSAHSTTKASCGTCFPRMSQAGAVPTDALSVPIKHACTLTTQPTIIDKHIHGFDGGHERLKTDGDVWRRWYALPNAKVIVFCRQEIQNFEGHCVTKIYKQGIHRDAVHCAIMQPGRQTCTPVPVLPPACAFGVKGGRPGIGNRSGKASSPTSVSSVISAGPPRILKPRRITYCG